MRRKTNSLFMSVVLFISLFFGGLTPQAAAQNLSVHFIDVGQGDSIFIHTPQGENILIDAGNKNKGDAVVNYLKKQKVKTIHYMISTHPDADHIGGLDEVLKAFVVKNVYAPKVSHTTEAYKDFLKAVKRENLKIKSAKAGVSLPVKGKGITAKFLAPVKAYANSDLNNWSAVLLLKYNKNTYLFTGDAEFKSEKDMLSKKVLSKVDVLKVGHHGAKSSTSKDFLNVGKPTYSVISAGKGNQYKHPTTETLNRLKAAKSKIYRTDMQGTIISTSDGKTVRFNKKPYTSTAATPTKATAYKLTATLDKKTPKQNSTIQLTVKGLPKGTRYKAVFHYKSKDTIYYGKAGESLSVKIGTAAKGYKVKINVSSTYKGKAYKAETSFTPK